MSIKEFKPDFNRLKKVLLRTGEPDILPLYEYWADDEIMQAFIGKPLDLKGIVEFCYKIGYDYVYAKTLFAYDTFKNSAKDTAQLSRGDRSFVENNRGVIENRKDFDKYEWPEVNSSIVYEINKTGSYLPDGMKLVVDLASGGVLECIMSLMGYVPFSYALYEDEQLVWDIVERLGKDHLKVLKTLFANTEMENIGAIVLSDDMGYNHSTMISPEALRKYIFPFEKKIVDLVHEYELPFIYHSCGNLVEVMDDVIGLGIDAKHSFEDKIMPVTEAKRRYGDRIAILGGIDVNFLCLEGEEEVRKHVGNVIRECAPGGGYALGTGNTVANYIPLKNYLAMVEERRKKGMYPISL